METQEENPGPKSKVEAASSAASTLVATSVRHVNLPRRVALLEGDQEAPQQTPLLGQQTSNIQQIVLSSPTSTSNSTIAISSQPGTTSNLNTVVPTSKQIVLSNQAVDQTVLPFHPGANVQQMILPAQPVSSLHPTALTQRPSSSAQQLAVPSQPSPSKQQILITSQPASSIHQVVLPNNQPTSSSTQQIVIPSQPSSSIQHIVLQSPTPTSSQQTALHSQRGIAGIQQTGPIQHIHSPGQQVSTLDELKNSKRQVLSLPNSSVTKNLAVTGQSKSYPTAISAHHGTKLQESVAVSSSPVLLGNLPVSNDVQTSSQEKSGLAYSTSNIQQVKLPSAAGQHVVLTDQAMVEHQEMPPGSSGSRHGGEIMNFSAEQEVPAVKTESSSQSAINQYTIEERDLVIAGIQDMGEEAAVGQQGDVDVRPEDNHHLEGEQYVTVVQDGQTYAIPLADYEAMFAKEETIPVTEVPAQNSSNEISHTAESGLSMRWMSAGAFDLPPRKKIVPNISLQKPQAKSPLRPIKVDNWGIFLLNRLQNCFQRKEFCDLTIRFPEKNAQIKVHKLVVNACTEYFTSAEKNGKLIDGIVDMPANFLPEAMAPIIRFMYTGKLELKEDSFQKLYDTASLLNMTVLTKLMDTQVTSPPNGLEKKKRKISSADDDPFNQVKKFKKMEEIVKQERLKMEKMKNLQKLRQEKEELEKQKLPGKKLPIWKKRSYGGEGNRIIGLDNSLKPKYISQNLDKEKENEKIRQNLDEISSKPSPAFPYRIPKAEDAPNQAEPAAEFAERRISVQTTYRRKTSPDKPKIPRKLREIQEHLMFEKILRTGSKNTLMKKAEEEGGGGAPKPEQNPQTVEKTAAAEEIKELGQEQAQRKEMEEEQEEEDDYFDNDAEFGPDEYLDDVDSPDPDPAPETDNAKPAELEGGLKNQQDNQMPHEASREPDPGELAMKTVNFNIKPDPEQSTSHQPRKSQPVMQDQGSKPVPKPADTNLPDPPAESQEHVSPAQPDQQRVADPPLELNERVPPLQPDGQPEAQVRGGTKVTGVGQEESILPDPESHSAAAITTTDIHTELDDALEEFSRVAEKEAMEMEDAEDEASANAGSTEEKKARRGRPPKWLQEKALAMKPPPPPEKSSSKANNEESLSKPGEDQTKVIAEILRKYPDILKQNKPVKIKMSVVENGKPSTQVITLKPQGLKQEQQQPAAADRMPFFSGTGLKSLPKVLYTGRRGRPKKLRAGEEDPHAEERKRIKEKLLKNCPNLAMQIGGDDDDIDDPPATAVARGKEVRPGGEKPATDAADQSKMDGLKAVTTTTATTTAIVGGGPVDFGQTALPFVPGGGHEVGHQYHVQPGLMHLQVPDHGLGLQRLQPLDDGHQAGITRAVLAEPQQQAAGTLDFTSSGSILVENGTTQYLVPHNSEYIQILENPGEEPKYVYVMDVKSSENLVVPQAAIMNTSTVHMVPQAFIPVSAAVVQGGQAHGGSCLQVVQALPGPHQQPAIDNTTQGLEQAPGSILPDNSSSSSCVVAGMSNQLVDSIVPTPASTAAVAATVNLPLPDSVSMQVLGGGDDGIQQAQQHPVPAASTIPEFLGPINPPPISVSAAAVPPTTVTREVDKIVSDWDSDNE